MELGTGHVGVSFPGRGVTVYRVNLQLRGEETREHSHATSSTPQDSTQGPPLQPVVALQDLSYSPRLTLEQCHLATFPGTGIIGDNYMQKKPRAGLGVANTSGEGKGDSANPHPGSKHHCCT